MPAEKSGARVQVGDWIVEPALDSISRDGKTHKLEPRTMRLLMCLIDSAGTVVSIEHLLNEVWTGVIVGSASVYQAVSQLRKLLGDTDPEPTYIETVPRKGYRLIAAVGAVDPPRQVTTADQPPAATPRVRSAATPHRLGLMAMLGIALAALMSLAWLLLRKPPLAEAAAASIAVLPFVDLTAEKNDQPFCDGLTEELSNWLSQIPTLRVVARGGIFESTDDRVSHKEHDLPERLLQFQQRLARWKPFQQLLKFYYELVAVGHVGSLPVEVLERPPAF
jgi:DNA-binding winged helix-turn-helix (wHTH) protein